MITCKMTDARLADEAIVADGFVTAIWQRNFDGFTIGIQEDIDILPFVTTCIVFQAECNERRPYPRLPYRGGVISHVQELQMLADKIGTSKSESGMILAELDQVLIVLENLRIFLQSQSRWLMLSGDSKEL